MTDYAQRAAVARLAHTGGRREIPAGLKVSLATEEYRPSDEDMLRAEISHIRLCSTQWLRQLDSDAYRCGKKAMDTRALIVASDEGGHILTLFDSDPGGEASRAVNQANEIVDRIKFMESVIAAGEQNPELAEIGEHFTDTLEGLYHDLETVVGDRPVPPGFIVGVWLELAFSQPEIRMVDTLWVAADQWISGFEAGIDDMAERYMQVHNFRTKGRKLDVVLRCEHSTDPRVRALGEEIRARAREAGVPPKYEDTWNALKALPEEADLPIAMQLAEELITFGPEGGRLDA